MRRPGGNPSRQRTRPSSSNPSPRRRRGALTGKARSASAAAGLSLPSFDGGGAGWRRWAVVSGWRGARRRGGEHGRRRRVCWLLRGGLRGAPRRGCGELGVGAQMGSCGPRWARAGLHPRGVQLRRMVAAARRRRRAPRPGSGGGRQGCGAAWRHGRGSDAAARWGRRRPRALGLGRGGPDLGPVWAPADRSVQRGGGGCWLPRPFCVLPRPLRTPSSTGTAPG